jgi:transposase InsO family protein
VKYAIIKGSNELPKARSFKLFEVSSSGYYDWLKRQPSQRCIGHVALDKLIRRIYFEHKGCYGYRRICEELADEGIQTSTERIRRRMKKLDLRGIQSRKFKHTTDSNHALPIAANVLKQNFNFDQPNKGWVGDITYVRVKQRWLYLAVVVDLYSRKVVGWSMSQRINADLVCKALNHALQCRGYPTGVIVHTDRGSQYCSAAYQQIISAHKLVPSMSGKGNCYDNAACESFFHTLKVEHIYQESYADIEQAKSSIFWYIEVYYNRKRKHSSIGYKSPINFEIMMAEMPSETVR